MDLEQRFDWKISKLERAWAQEARTPELALRLAEAYFQKGYYLGKGEDWFELAIERVSEAIDMGLVTSEACTLLANALYGRHEFEASGEAYRRALELDPKNALALVGLGNLEKKRGDFQRARECFQRAAELTPDLWQAHYNLGGAYFQEARARGFQASDPLLEKAIYHLIRALRLKPFENFIGNIHKDLGELFLHTRQYQEARRFFTRLLTHEKYATLAHYYLGLTHYALEKYHLAIQNFRNFLKAEPDNALAWARIGLAWLDLKSYGKARESCERALQLDAENVLARFTIGCTYMDERAYLEATRVFHKLLEQTPDYFPAYVELVRCYFNSKNYEWIYRQLREEIKYFENSDGNDGGREYYVGVRGAFRHRIDVLLAQLREIGQRAFPVLLELLNLVRNDSLRFQIFEELYLVSRKAKLDEVLGLLQEPARFYSPELARAIQVLAPFLSEEVLIQAFDVDEDALRRRALGRTTGALHQEAVNELVDEVKQEYQVFRVALIKSLASKASEVSVEFLEQVLEHTDRILRVSAAAALAPKGNDNALAVLEDQAERLEPGPELKRLEELIRVGQERRSEMLNVLRMARIPERMRNHPEVARLKKEDLKPAPTHCIVCAKGTRDVDRMLAGAHVMICTGCVRDLWKDREFIRATDTREASCSFCKKTIFEVDHLFVRRGTHMCDRCLELAMGIVEREEVELFLDELGPG